MVENVCWGTRVPQQTLYILLDKQPELVNMSINLTDFEINLSPQVLSELFESLDSDTPPDRAMKFMVSDIIRRAHVFINRFMYSYFLDDEPIHEFVGLQFRDNETCKLLEEIKYRLIITESGATVYTPGEIPLDDMYDIRLVIAESQQPEFYEDKPQRNPRQNSKADSSGSETA